MRETVTQLPPIVYVSNAGWNYGLPTNRQQLPLRLAAYTQVLYASPLSLSQVLLGRVRLQDYRRGTQQVAPGVHILHNLRLLPLVRGQIWPLTYFDRWLTTHTLVQNVRRMGHRRPILWMYYPPSFQHLIGKLDESLSVYHCTDDHAGYAAELGLDAEQIAQGESRLVESVDVVFATSRPLYEKHVRRNPHTYLMPNVADVQRFAPVARGEVSPAVDLANLPCPIVGFIGAVDAYKIDFDLVSDVAHRLPGWSFVFIGPVGVGDRTRAEGLPRAENIHFLGAREYAALPAYLAGFDICTIPYRLNRYTSGVFPLKFWEYLAAGKPVVATPLPGLRDEADHAFFASDADGFVDALLEAAATATEPTSIGHRLERAAQNSWESRAAEMVQVLVERLG